jgi:hypothetical protein
MWQCYDGVHLAPMVPLLEMKWLYVSRRPRHFCLTNRPYAINFFLPLHSKANIATGERRPPCASRLLPVSRYETHRLHAPAQRHQGTYSHHKSSKFTRSNDFVNKPRRSSKHIQTHPQHC